MRVNLKRSIIFVLVSMLLLSLIACSGDNNSDANQTTVTTTTTKATTTKSTTTKSTTTEEIKEPMKFTVMGYSTNGGPITEEGTVIEKALEEKFNMELTPVPINVFDKEQVSIYLAANKTPDVMYFTSEPETRKYIASGILRTITKEMIEEGAPATYETITSLSPDGLAWELSSGIDGKLYGLPIVRIDSAAGFPMIIRKDWMKAVGVEEMPRSIADLEYIFRKFREEDPDNDGVKDTYGLAGRGYGSSKSLLAYIYGAFGIMPGEMVLNNGKIVFADATEDYKDCLKLLQSWYVQGILDPETPLPANDYKGKFVEGITGSLNISYPNVSTFAAVSMWNLLVENDPDAERLLLGEIKGPKGYSGTRRFNVEGGQTISFRLGLEDERVLAYLGMLDYSVGDRDGFILGRFGIEGEHYTVADDGHIIALPEYDGNGRTQTGGWYYQSTIYNQMQLEVIYSEEELEFVNYAISLPRIPVEVAIGSLPSYIKNAADISNITQEFWSNAVSNKIDIDEKWDEYVDKLKASGLEAIEFEANEKYNKRMNANQ